MKKYIKLNFIILIFIVLISAAILIVACTNNVENPIVEQPDDSIFYTINYIYPDIGGYYIGGGDRNQYVKKGCDGVEVTVTPQEGYYFVKWSDGVTTPNRCETNVQSNLTLIPIFQKINISVNYSADIGGSLLGKLSQNIEYGNAPEEVTAVPNSGYLFAGWSDGVMTDTREDKDLKQDIAVSARFVNKTKVLNYEFEMPSIYNKQVRIEYGDLEATEFYIPNREGYIFDGWYLDSKLTIKVTDGNGYYYRGNTIFFDEGITLYPRWITEINQSFKLLLVFLENVDAKLPTIENEIIDINYKMSLVERTICELIPDQVAGYLNNWFDGSVTFEVDTLYATEPIKTESYNSIEPGWPLIQTPSNHHILEANFIPELYPVLHDYRSIIVTGSMNDFERELHNYAGVAREKYAYISLEEIIFPLNNGFRLQDYLDMNPIIWDLPISTYLHEFAHTIEEGYPKKALHDVVKYYWKDYGMQGRDIELIGLYLQNKTKIDGETVGIPMDFWRGNINVNVQYHPTSFEGADNGKVISISEYSFISNSYGKNISFGSDITVQAIPFEGWRFVSWSDGVKTAIRHDTNIISQIRIYAIFAKIE